MVEERSEVAEHIGERTHLGGAAGGGKQPVGGVLRPLSLEPMMGDPLGRGS